MGGVTNAFVICTAFARRSSTSDSCGVCATQIALRSHHAHNRVIAQKAPIAWIVVIRARLRTSVCTRATRPAKGKCALANGRTKGPQQRRAGQDCSQLALLLPTPTPGPGAHRFPVSSIGSRLNRHHCLRVYCTVIWSDFQAFHSSIFDVGWKGRLVLWAAPLLQDEWRERILRVVQHICQTISPCIILVERREAKGILDKLEQAKPRVEAVINALVAIG